MNYNSAKRKISRWVLMGSMALPLSPVVSLTPALAVTINSPAFDLIPYETLSIGNRSGCLRQAKMVITNETEWQRVWNIHNQGQASTAKLPKIDFSKQVVLALIMGTSQTPGATIEIAQVVYSPREILVYYYTNYQNDQKAAKNIESLQPYHFAAIDKSTKPIRFVDALNANCTICVM